jgi:glycosyltransferase involved in cell wall biosynthesis
MKVGFDVSPLCRPHPPGIVRVTRGLVETLERRGRFQLVRLEPPASARLSRWRRTGLPDAIDAYRLDLVHSPVSAFTPFGRGRRVQTIHELPWRAGVEENADWKHRAWASIGPLRADRVVVATEVTARDVRAEAPYAASKVRTCPWGVDPIFTHEPAREDELVLARFGLTGMPFVLCAGAVRAKKRLAATLRGVAALRRRVREPMAVVVTGERTRDLVADLILADELGLEHVRAVGPVSDATLVALTRRASASALLSRSEGFGFPVLEAQACGTPAIVPVASAQAEIAGESGIAVDADDADSVADGLLLALADRERSSAASRANAARFTWDRCAECIERVWEELA